jgi:hypothetical protein
MMKIFYSKIALILQTVFITVLIQPVFVFSQGSQIPDDRDQLQQDEAYHGPPIEYYIETKNVREHNQRNQPQKKRETGTSFGSMAKTLKKNQSNKSQKKQTFSFGNIADRIRSRSSTANREESATANYRIKIQKRKLK